MILGGEVLFKALLYDGPGLYIQIYVIGYNHMVEAVTLHLLVSSLNRLSVSSCVALKLFELVHVSGLN